MRVACTPGRAIENFSGKSTVMFFVYDTKCEFLRTNSTPHFRLLICTQEFTFRTIKKKNGTVEVSENLKNRASACGQPTQRFPGVDYDHGPLCACTSKTGFQGGSALDTSL